MWYDELADGKLKDETLALKAKIEGSRFDMMKYSFDDDEEYITIKDSEYLNHSKDSLDAYRELLCLIDEGWIVTTPDE
ncbi:hypothetical protein Tco_0976706 [Tanacetum coccineum]|uniref:Uncharacterized protein n=1 Tax=Tanacetum coccineum TaxID=301880 RepID=A0ABQ5EI61_9ASTR